MGDEKCPRCGATGFSVNYGIHVDLERAGIANPEALGELMVALATLKQNRGSVHEDVCIDRVFEKYARVRGEVGDG